MSQSPCDEIRDDLAEYADGALTGEQADTVARHLDECERCRQTVTDLQESLALTQAIWQDNLEHTDPARSGRVRTQRLWLRYGAAAAVLVLAACGLLFTNRPRRTNEQTLTVEEVQRQVDRAARAAELVVATRILAQCEGVEALVARQRQYILSHYGDTPAAATLKANGKALLKGPEND